MSYEHLRGLMGGTPHTTTGLPMVGVTLRPHLSLVPVPDAVEDFDITEDATDQWQDRALCAQTDPEAFFPEKGGSTREAKKICLGCEVRSECLDYALAHDERFGIWVASPSGSAAASSAESSDATCVTSAGDPPRPAAPRLRSPVIRRRSSGR